MKTNSVTGSFTLSSIVGEVVHDPAFGSFGRLLFPVDMPVPDSMTLKEVTSSRTYLWYSNLHPDKTVEVVNKLKRRALSGERIFYPIYPEEEIRHDPDLADTGLFCLHGKPGEKFAIINAGGGFSYVAAMHDAFPHALELARRGYTAFVLIYRPTHPYQDLARAIQLIEANAEILRVNPDGYSLWGGSAGARMAAALGNAKNLRYLAGDVPQAAMVVTQYTGYDEVSRSDAPTYACVGTNDRIAAWRIMERRLRALESYGIPTRFHVYKGLHHGFGIGTGTVADGWTMPWHSGRRIHRMACMA
jgi:acetyl esterase/lipase